MNRIGIQRRPACQTGRALFETRTPVYPASAAPNTPDVYPVNSPTLPNRPARLMNNPVAIAVGAAPPRIPAPMFMGDVGRNTRTIYKNRDGIPRSRMRNP